MEPKDIAISIALAGTLTASGCVTDRYIDSKEFEGEDIVEPNISSLELLEEKEEDNTSSIEIPLPQELPPQESLLDTYSPEAWDYDNNSDELLLIEEDIVGETVEKLTTELVVESGKLNFNNLSGYELDSIEEIGEGFVVKTVAKTPIYVIPIDTFGTVKNNENIVEVLTDKENQYQIAQKRTLINKEGEEIEIGMISNTFGGKYVLGLVLSYSKDEQDINFVERDESFLATTSYVVGREDTSPNEIRNIISAWINLSNFQDITGPIQGGKYYSYINMIGLASPNYRLVDFVGAMDGRGIITRAGGVCTTATAMSALLFEVENPQNINRAPHVSRYYQGPFSRSAYEIDTTIYIYEDGQQDLTWRIQNPNFSYYLKTNVDIFPMGERVDDSSLSSDSFAIFTLSFVKDYPTSQTTSLLKQLEIYENFRESNSGEIKEREKDVKLYLPDTARTELAGLVYGYENLESIRDEIEGDYLIEDIKEFQNIVNNYDKSISNRSFTDYLRTTEWYSRKVGSFDNGKINLALKFIDAVKIENQPIQSIGFINMLSQLYPELNILNISNSSPYIANRLLPSMGDIYEDRKTLRYGDRTIIAGNKLGLDDYQKGDIFLNTSLGIKLNSNGEVDYVNGTPIGHTGVILGKYYNQNGEVILLGVDANRSRDGQIRMFIINERNSNELLGSGTRYILRSPETN